MKNSRELLVEKILIENYEKYYRLAFSYVHNEADAMDIVQEGACKAMLKGKAEKEDTEKPLPIVTDGEVLELVSASVKEGKTTPPKHFTDVIHFESRQWKYSKCKGAG